MAIGAQNGGISVGNGSLPQVVVGSAHSPWSQINDDARTAQATTVQCAPGTVSDSVFHWKLVSHGTTGGSIRARSPIASTALTSPVVALIGAFVSKGGVSDPSGVNDGSIQYKRLDSVNILDGGQTLTFPASPTTSNCQNDAVWWYSAEPTIGGYDFRGAKWVGIFVISAGASTASAAMPIDILFMNG